MSALAALAAAMPLVSPTERRATPRKPDREAAKRRKREKQMKRKARAKRR
jgi:hypothetical protein